MKPPSRHCAHPRRPAKRARSRGFTLVELMVALTGGLVISVFVFMMASQGSKFYQQEARISNATIGVMNGFQRLRGDIARAGFLASPNVARDRVVCSGKTAAEGWTEARKSLREMGGVRIAVGGSRGTDESDEGVSAELAAFWDANNLNPDQLILAGSFSSTDQFPAAEIGQPNPAGQPNVWHVYLQPNSPAMARLGYRTDGTQTPAAQLALVQQAFDPDGAERVLRILDRKGNHHYAVIDSVAMGTLPSSGAQVPYILLTDDVVLKQESRTTACGLQGLNVGATVNVVNFVRYGLRNLNDADAYPEFAAIYADETEGSYEETRAELVREELDVAGTPIPGTLELVAEYAVDLKFSLSILEATGLTELAEGAPEIAQIAGDPLVNGRPDQIRSVHARLAVRSREADRDQNVNLAATDLPLNGLYRVGLGDQGGAPFARVRTLQADIALRNHMRVMP